MSVFVVLELIFMYFKHPQSSNLYISQIRDFEQFYTLKYYVFKVSVLCSTNTFCNVFQVCQLYKPLDFGIFQNVVV